MEGFAERQAEFEARLNGFSTATPCRIEALKQQVIQAVECGDAVTIKALHDSGQWKDLEMAMGFHWNCDGDGDRKKYYTALSLAASHSQFEIMHLLIGLGAKVVEKRDHHYLASNAAASVGFREGLELLKTRGCDLHEADNHGSTPILTGAKYGHTIHHQVEQPAFFKMTTPLPGIHMGPLKDSHKTGQSYLSSVNRGRTFRGFNNNGRKGSDQARRPGEMPSGMYGPPAVN
jgi:hypothetical protein